MLIQANELLEAVLCNAARRLDPAKPRRLRLKYPPLQPRSPPRVCALYWRPLLTDQCLNVLFH